MSQFAFLASEFAEMHGLAAQAETLAANDPRAACVYARLALETIVNWLYRHESGLKNPYETTLAARIHEPTFQKLLGPALIAKARIVKDIGNRAAHETGAIAFSQAATSLRELFHLSYWLAHSYGRQKRPDPGLSFSPEALPRSKSVPAATLAALQQAAARFAEAVKAREEAEAKRLATEAERTKLEAELAALRGEIAAAKVANALAPDTHDYNEAETRDAFIDILLGEAGWRFTKPGYDTEFPVTGMPNNTGEGFVDYVLWGDNGLPLGLLEAKRTRRDPRVGQQQAKLYADCLERQFGQRPVIFYSNGYEHWIWDDLRYPPRPIQGFLTKGELELAIQRRSARTPLSSLKPDSQIVERYYQERAIRRVAETFDGDNLRKALLVMATGSGKTRTVIALCDLLMRANWARRVLFLADRVALVRQAVGAFRTFLPGTPPVNLVNEKNTQGRVYVSTYPTMMGLIDRQEEGGRRFGPGHFDLIIIDEAHRSVYRKYGAIFDYFDSILVGLTATPKDEIDRDTYRLFNLQRGVPTDAYDLDEAVKDGFLVPPKAVSVPLRFMHEGIKYDDLSDDEKETWDAIEWDEDGNVPASVEAPALNQWLFNADTVDKVLEHLMTHGLHVADGDRLGKTIIFAKSHDHAEFIVRRFDENYPHLQGSFARVIDFKTEYAQSLIDEFSQKEKPPYIAVSVDMLDTGIDVPEIVNLVFFKPVHSKMKFWQMIGRGTRLCRDLFGPGQDKKFFYVFDFCRNFEFFSQNPEQADASIPDSLSKRLFVERVELIGVIDELGDTARNRAPAGAAEAPSGFGPDKRAGALRELRDSLIHRLHAEVAEMSLDNFLVRPKRRHVEKYTRAQGWKGLTFDARQELIDEVAGLPSGLEDNDLAAKEFDLLILKAQLAVLLSDPKLPRHKEKIVKICGSLAALANIPAVAAQMALIEEVQTEPFWEGVTAPILENVRRKLRDLVRLITAEQRPRIYSDFEDELGVASESEILGSAPAVDMERFRRKALFFLREHENHITIQKIRRNEQLTPIDIAELERIMASAGVGNTEELENVRANGGLGLFIRELVGMDREAAKLAFEKFSSTRILSANQIDFLNLIIDHLTARGVVDPAVLYECPFTDLNPLGVSGVFGEGGAAELVSILKDVRDRAAA